MLYPALYWRAMRRMDRRHAVLRDAVARHPELRDAMTLSAEWTLFCEAVRLVNRMAQLRLAVA